MKNILLYRNRNQVHNPLRPAPNSRDVSRSSRYAGRRMRWTLRRQVIFHRTRTPAADGEVVWSWRRDRGVKLARGIAPATVATNAAHRGEHEGNRKTIARGKPGCPGCTCSSNPCAFFRTRGYGRSRRPAFPAPSSQEGQRDANNPGENLPRECTHAPSRALTVCSNSENLPAPVGPDFQDAIPGNRIDRPLTRKSIAPGSGTSIASGQYACEGKNS
jgi:hypothetical protein